MTVLGLIIAILLAASPAGPAPRAPDDPKAPGPLRADMEKVDYGKVLCGEIVSRKITVRNHGAGDVTLARIGFTCGCTIPSITLPTGEVVPREKLGDGPICTLGPGRSCRIELEFQPQILTGRLERQLFFYTAGSERPALTLPVVAEIRPAFTLEPRRFDFGRVTWEEPVSRTMIIRSAGAGAFRIAGFSGLPPFFTCKAEELEDEPVSTWLLEMTIARKPPAGDQSLLLVLDIESERIASLKIYGSATIEPDILFAAAPGGDSINFGVLQQGEGATAEVDIVNRRPDVPYEIEDVLLDSAHGAFLDVKLHTIEAGLRFKLILRVKPGLDARFFRGTITLLSSHPDLERKVIAFKGWMNLSDPAKKETP